MILIFILASRLMINYEYAKIHSPDPLPASALSVEGEASASDLPQIGLEEMLGAMTIQDLGAGEVAKEEDVVMTE